MIVAVRRALAGLALVLVVGFWTESSLAHAASPSPTASATGKTSAQASDSASPASGVNGDTSIEESPDLAPNNTNQVIALSAAGALALAAGLVVFVRRT